MYIVYKQIYNNLANIVLLRWFKGKVVSLLSNVLHEITIRFEFQIPPNRTIRLQ